ncbi:MAG: methionyl-tRNA formyltransferase [Gemmatimonadota bacterium]
MRVVFFGTPAFAVPSLQGLLDNQLEVVMVVTQPDRARGRSRSTLLPPPVKELALAHGIAVLQPERPTGDEFLAALRGAAPDLGIVVAYGHILKPAVLLVPRLGMINVHASLLPALRGAAPIAWSILRGDARTGVTIMQMEAGLDSGPILHQVETAIGPDETAGELTERLAKVGAGALVDCLATIREGRAAPIPQDHARATFAPKIDRSLARIMWTESAAAVADRVRAFDPAPGAWTTAGSLEVKCFRPRTTDDRGEPGLVLRAADELVIGAGAGAVAIAEVQPAGKPRMAAADWVHGRGIAVGARFT